MLDLHKILNVFGQYRVLDNVKNYFDVLCVRGSGEVAVQLLTSILPYRVEQHHKEILHVRQFTWVPLIVGEVVANRLVSNLIHEQVSLVEEEDDGDAAEAAVVDNRVEDVYALDDSVGHAVLQQTLVKRARRHKKQD